MTSFETIDPGFGRYVMGNAPLKKLATGFDWAEGPVWFGDAGCLLFSDIPNNKILRWTPGLGISIYREPSNFSNGHSRDRKGRLVSCEHGLRRVTRTEHDGRITVIADGFDGKQLNSPNDVVVKSDGSIWFTDPHYGILTDYEGHKSAQELPCQVYRVETRRGFTLPIPGGCFTEICNIFGCLMWRTTGCLVARYSIRLAPAVQTAFAQILMAICGLRQRTACIALRPTGI